jgi:hypothetical protein
MFVLGFLVPAAYWPWLWSPAMSPKWIALSCLAPALLLYQDGPFRLTRAHLFGAALILWATLSVAWSPVPLYSLNGLWQAVALPAVCFCLGSQASTLRPLFIGAGLGMVASSTVAIGQLAGWIDWPTINIPSGLFLNKNFMAEAAALVLIWLIAERVWWLAVPVMPAIALADAKGALLALAVGLVPLFWKTRSWVIGGLLVAVMALFDHAYVMNGTATMTERLDIWTGASHGIGMFGSGIGSYGFVSNQVLPDGHAMHAHNDYLELVYELGMIGALLGALFVWELRGLLTTARLVLIVFAVEACFAFPAHLPVTVALAALVAGHAVRDRVMVRRVATHRRNFGNPGIAGVPL